jgi:hypothetical protein
MNINRHLYYFIVGTKFLAFTNLLSVVINLNVIRPAWQIDYTEVYKANLIQCPPKGIVRQHVMN